MTITDFLLAQIAKDEAVARTAQAESPTPWENADGTLYDAGVRTIAGYAGGDTAPHILRHAPDRVLAECEAKRRIVTDHAPIRLGDEWWCSRCDQTQRPGQRDDSRNYEPSPCPTLLALASVYAGHPDFDPAWRAE